MKHPLLLDALPLLFGILLSFAFAPYHIWPLAIISPAILLCILNLSTPARGFIRSWLFGIGLFGCGIYWVIISIHTYGDVSMWLSLLITGMFVLLLGLFIGLTGYFYRLFRHHHPIATNCLAFPAIWLLLEFIRSELFGGFPWLLQGYGVTQTTLANFAPLFSVFGLSLITLVLSGLLVSAIELNTWRERAGPVAGMIGIFLLGWLLSFVQWTTPIGKPLSVALVQGNIPVSLKWDARSQVKTLETYFDLTKPYLGKDIIVWPENAIPVFRSEAKPFLKLLNGTMDTHHSALLLGLPLDSNDSENVYNGAVVVGNGFGSYKKRHLVPFGEYVPLQAVVGKFFQFLAIPMSGFSEGPWKQPLLRMQNARVALYICYETAFPLEVRGTINNANLLVSISDDGWFGHSIGPMQHAQIASVRALETGRYMLRATNTGVTSIVDPHGNTIATYPSFKRGVLTGEVREMRGQTPWMRFGLIPIWMLLVMMLAGAYFSRKD